MSKLPYQRLLRVSQLLAGIVALLFGLGERRLQELDRRGAAIATAAAAAAAASDDRRGRRGRTAGPLRNGKPPEEREMQERARPRRREREREGEECADAWLYEQAVRPFSRVTEASGGCFTLFVERGGQGSGRHFCRSR